MSYGAPDLVLEKKNTDVYLTVKDKKNDTANTFSLDVDTVNQMVVTLISF